MGFAVYEMTDDLPFLAKGRQYWANEKTGLIYGCESDGVRMAHSLRPGLQEYLWLLIASEDKPIRCVGLEPDADDDDEDDI